MGGRWVYNVKDGPDDSEVYKARYVAKGFTQVEGMDYFETFSPTVKMTSIRAFMQIAAEFNLSVSQMDFSTLRSTLKFTFSNPKDLRSLGVSCVD